MKYFTLIYTAVLTLLFSNCSEDQVSFENRNSEKITAENLSSNRILGSESQMTGYQGQLPYVITSSDKGEDLLEFVMTNNIHENTENRDLDWKVFDQIYSSKLNTGQKQYVAFLVLAKKDLLKDFSNNPTDFKAKKIKFYTEVLVNSDYTGYCLLYNALSVLKSQNFVSNDISQMKTLVLENYNRQKRSHDETIRSFQSKPSEQTDYFLKKLQENLEYVERIRSL